MKNIVALLKCQVIQDVKRFFEIMFLGKFTIHTNKTQTSFEFLSLDRHIYNANYTCFKFIIGVKE